METAKEDAPFLLTVTGVRRSRSQPLSPFWTYIYGTFSRLLQQGHSFFIQMIYLCASSAMRKDLLVSSLSVR